MTDSAIATRASERKQVTARRLSAVSRRLTAERGLTGFTIEEVCDEVGVSRRTFFNYFPSKDEAVLGVDEAEEMRALSERFLALGSRGWSAVIDDFIDLAADVVNNSDMSAEEHRVLMIVMEREPRLLARFIGMGRDREAEIAALMAQREGVAVDDLHVIALLSLTSTLMRATAEKLLTSGNPDDFGVSLRNSLAAIRAVLEIPTPRKAQQ